jgi:hypothetical protein
MKEFDYTFTGAIPEQLSIRFYTTGRCGGDAGHGGAAFIELSMEDGGGGFTVLSEFGGKQEQSDNVESVRVAVFGDWELDGMAICFLELGRALLARDDALKTREDWHEGKFY